MDARAGGSTSPLVASPEKIAAYLSERAETRSVASVKHSAAAIALCCVMRDCLLRLSEAAALRWKHIELESNGTGRLRIKRSKTDPAGTGAVGFLSREIVRALKAIRPPEPQTGSFYTFSVYAQPAAPYDPEASVFGLSARSVSNRIRAAAQAAGLPGSFYGHSARVGMARDLAAAGTELPALMQAGRWKSESMPALYTRNEAAGRGAVARYYGQA